MKLFVRCKRYGNDCYASYQGQDLETVERLLADLGATDVQFMEETEWIAAQQNQ